MDKLNLGSAAIVSIVGLASFFVLFIVFFAIDWIAPTIVCGLAFGVCGVCCIVCVSEIVNRNEKIEKERRRQERLK